jgi:hypothetical protein
LAGGWRRIPRQRDQLKRCDDVNSTMAMPETEGSIEK